MTTLNPRRLGDALRAGACGIHPLEAGTGLLASIDWEAAVTALHAGELPASGGERRMLLIAASIAGGIPVSLCDVLPGIDRRNASLVVGAVARAAGLAGHRGCSPESPSSGQDGTRTAVSPDHEPAPGA